MLNAIPKLKTDRTPNLILGAIVLHGVAFIVCYLFLWNIGLIDGLPTNKSLNNWDAAWYQNIKNTGYHYMAGENNPMAFFPFFPLVWRCTGLDAKGISLINMIIFYAGFYYLSRHLNLTRRRALFYLTTPSLFFCFVPYSEALFFLGGVMLIVGLDRENVLIAAIGILVCGLTRSIAPVLILPIIFALFVSYGTFHRTVTRCLFYCTLLISTILLAYFIQFLYSGHWWVFFEVQKSWNREFRIPSLPFTTLTGRNMLWLDGLALLICMLALAVTASKLYMWFGRYTQMKGKPSFPLSYCYLALVGFVGTFYSGNAGVEQGTSLYSLNRFVFCSPFFIVFSNFLFDEADGRKYGYYLYFLVPITWLMLGVYMGYGSEFGYMRTPMYFLSMTCYVMLYAVVFRDWTLYYFTCLTNIILQVLLFNSFLHGHWVA